MSKEEIIEKTITALKKLPAEKGVEVVDFAAFMVKKYEEEDLLSDIHRLAEDTEIFNVLNKEEDIYSLADLKRTF
jgi:formylmethanofuran dehydrogenase subunit A